MRVLVTGGSGQLAQCLRKTQPTEITALYAGKADLNLEDKQSLTRFLSENPVKYVLNCAAYTKVDLAEKERVAAYAANEAAVRNIAEVCRDKKIFPVHISTDFLFHGNFNRPIDELQHIHPIGVYAESKAAGEKALTNAGIPAAIVRTSWLYSEFGGNFMKTMLRLGAEKPKLTVIADQHGSPTYAVDLAQALWQMLFVFEKQPFKDLRLFHFSNYGVTTWYDFASAILEIAGITTPVEPILTHEYPVPTPRPAYSALWPRKFAQTFHIKIRHWRKALHEAVGALNAPGGKQA